MVESHKSVRSKVDTIHMKIQKFEDIESWQEAKKLTLTIYTLFSSTKDFGFRDQIQRASVSIMNNIAEGFERQSDKEFKQFLYIAKGSSGEVRSMLSLAFELRYITASDFEKLTQQVVSISKLLSGFIKSLNPVQ